MNEREYSIDARGYHCPIPLAMVSRKMNEIPGESVLTVLSDDPSFRNEMAVWCADTGNSMVEFKQEGGHYVATVQKGQGYKSRGFFDAVRFVLLGIRLHFIKHMMRLSGSKATRYLITFISIPEGVKADRWLEDTGVKKYTMLPVPSEITNHCGIVLGTADETGARYIFKLLSGQNFGVEGVYYVDDDKSVRPLKLR
jgi:TusA-related sulfurtransferase